MVGYFTKEIEFDSEKLEIEFEAHFSHGGFGYEHFGNKGFQKRLELDDITFEEKGLDREKIKYIKNLIRNGDFDDDAWASYDS